MDFATVISFAYTFAWSISFYGQFYENYRLKSVEGMSLDFLALNICGFAFYSLYSTIGFFFHQIKGAGTVVLADLIFAYHAFLMVLLWLVQTYIYPHGKNRLSRRAIYICLGLWSLVIIQTFLTSFLKIMPWTLYINPVSSLGYGKLILTIVKFIPVVNWNYQRKSTEGWSIFGVLSDLVGGACSFISGLLFTHHGINMGKLGLALISIFFDLIFTVQHYCIYPVSERSKPEDKFHEMNEVEMPEFPENKLQNVQETEKGTTESKLTETPEKQSVLGQGTEIEQKKQIQIDS